MDVSISIKLWFTIPDAQMYLCFLNCGKNKFLVEVRAYRDMQHCV